MLLLLCWAGVSCSSGGGGSFVAPPAPEWPRSDGDAANGRLSVPLSGNPGTLRWRFDLEARPSASPVVGPTGVIYVGTEAGELFALEPTGELRWRFSTGAPQAVGGLLADLHGRLYFGTEDGIFRAVSEEGIEIWRRDLGSFVPFSPLLEVDSFDLTVTGVFGGTEDGRFLALDGESGDIRWQVSDLGMPAGAPARDVDGRIYALATSGQLEVLSLRGTRLLRIETGDAPVAAPMLLDISPVVGFGTAMGAVRSWTQAGTPRWAADLPAPLAGGLARTSALSGGELLVLVVAVDEAGRVFLLDGRTGRPSGVCVGGESDGFPCWRDRDCELGSCAGEVFYPLGEAPAVPPTSGSDGTLVFFTRNLEGGTTVRLLSPKVCSAGERAGILCRTEADCPNASCTPETEEGGVAALRWSFSDGRCGGELEGTACRDDLDCSDGVPCLGTLAAVEHPPAVGLDGTLYFGTADGFLYALGP
ncbi:MAG: hypothetical protein KatS3mg076_0557 [Candidatus Binatia bacterium]|nr:MAG: hypothetical protein KatS3mg076_0557 [Candidatus Binatia bacterium]